jgi:hypothetical protein
MMWICRETVEPPKKAERTINQFPKTMSYLRSQVQVMTLFDSTKEVNKYRTIVADSHGRFCSLEAFEKKDLQFGGKIKRLNQLAMIKKLPLQFKTNIIVWPKNAEPYLVKSANTTQIKALSVNQNIGRIVFPPKKEYKLVNLNNALEKDNKSENWVNFNIFNLAEAANFGEGVRVGIHEADVYNDPLSECYDPCVKSPIVSKQLGKLGWGDFITEDPHSNLVASRMWAKYWITGYINKSDPISLGVGDASQESELFEIYNDALPFLINNGVNIVNYSAYYDSDKPCNNRPARDFELLQDYYQYKYGLLIVQAVGNLCASNPCINLTNSLLVGGANPTFSATDNNLHQAGSEIPHVVGTCHYDGGTCEDPIGQCGFVVLYKCTNGWTGIGNSVNAPGVTSIAALLLKILQTRESVQIIRPELLKAIILASANYSYFEGNPEDVQYSGKDTDPRCAGCPIDEDYPAIDCLFGSGKADGDRALALVNHGDYRYFDINSTSWDYVFDEFSIAEDKGNIQAAINWANAIDCDNLDCSEGIPVTHEFDLFLEQRIDGNWVPILKSQRRNGTIQWIRAHLKKFVNTPGNNRFRFVVQQVLRRVDRKTHLGFAFYGEGITSNEASGLVKIPESDRTPPSVTMEVMVDNALYILLPQNEDLHINAARNSKIEVKAYAKDSDGGVKDVCIIYSSSMTCTFGNLAQTTNALTAPTCNPDEQALSGFAYQERTVQKDFICEDYTGCRSGWTFSGSTITISAEGSNFSKTKQTAALIISIH